MKSLPLWRLTTDLCILLNRATQTRMPIKHRSHYGFWIVLKLLWVFGIVKLWPIVVSAASSFQLKDSSFIVLWSSFANFFCCTFSAVPFFVEDIFKGRPLHLSFLYSCGARMKLCVTFFDPSKATAIFTADACFQRVSKMFSLLFPGQTLFPGLLLL